MHYKKEYWEEAEEKILAPYALKSRNSRRLHREPNPAVNRTSYQRDWNRVLHSQSFRKLEFKTQVFSFGEGLDITRNRLTHSLEVLQIAVSIAHGLGVNSDCVMAISLAHDIGHPPFGHTGEDALKELTTDFNHNQHSLDIVMNLEKRYPDYDGLNLTTDVLEGLEKHSSDYDRPPLKGLIFPDTKFPSLEGQIVDYADTIAYRCHDLEDSLLSGIIDFIDFISAPPVIIKDIMPQKLQGDRNLYLSQLTRALINLYVGDIIENTNCNLKKHDIKSVEDVRKCDIKLVGFSHSLKTSNDSLGNYLFANFYKDYRIIRMMNKGKEIIKRLFTSFYGNQYLLPGDVRARITGGSYSKEKIIADYIASMTDREALRVYNSIFTN